MVRVNESKAVTKESEQKVRYVAYGLRGPASLKARCAAIASEMTREAQVPVSVSAVMRKFIAAGCEAYARISK